jgi:RNA polymerase sigma factor (sigma-70 family)
MGDPQPRPPPAALASRLVDAEIVARCRTGDEAAWEELVDRFARYVYAIAAQGFRLSRSDAEDVFQEVFARTYEHLPRLRDDGAIRPWIAQLTRRIAIDRLRHSKLERPAEDARDVEADSEELFSRLDEALSLHQALSALPDHCREIVDRFFARDQSYGTIAAELEIPQGTIASRISRCLAMLRVELSE